LTGVIADIPDRRISQNTCKKYGVTVEYDSQGKISKHIYPYYACDTDDVKGTKVRLVKNKDFFVTGSAEGEPFGGDIPAGSTVRISYKYGDEHPVYGVPVYMDGIRVLEMGAAGVDSAL